MWAGVDVFMDSVERWQSLFQFKEGLLRFIYEKQLKAPSENQNVNKEISGGQQICWRGKEGILVVWFELEIKWKQSREVFLAKKQSLKFLIGWQVYVEQLVVKFLSKVMREVGSRAKFFKRFFEKRVWSLELDLFEFDDIEYYILGSLKDLLKRKNWWELERS